jgi:transcriptional regulator with XRE-family HTH domain
MHVGEEIRRRRKELGLTITQLAEKASMAFSAVSQIETGKRTPHSTSVVKLAAALGCEVGDLYPKAPSQLPLDWLSDERVPTLRFEDIPEEARAQLAERGYSDAYFVPPKEGEEEDKVEIRFYQVRLMDEDDRLLQRVRSLERQNAALQRQLQKAERVRRRPA